jgi:hypothetical protein
MQDSPQQQMQPPWMSFWDIFWLLSLQPFTDVQQNGEEHWKGKQYCHTIVATIVATRK